MESMDQSLLDDIIRRLLQVRKHQQVQLSHSEVRQLCVVSRDILLKEPSLLELKSPIKIAGDLHGQYIDLLTIFEYGGLPPNSNYLFLGNYVDCGRHSLETVLLLLAFKIKYPDNLFLLRGSHECASMNGIYGFDYECERRFSIGLWEVFNDCFNCLPVAALINDKILCIHGGLSPDLHSLDQLRNIERPTDVPDSGLLCDLLWSDPSAAIQGWRVIVNCPGYTFGAEKVKEFLEKHDLDLICRGHQVVEDGYEFFAERRLVTIFSVPNLAGLFDNVGALMSVDANLRCSFQILEPEFESLRFGRGISVPKTQPGSSSGADDAKLSRLLSGGLLGYDEEAPWIKRTEETKKKSKSGRSTRANPSQSTPATTKYRSKSSEVKPLERTRKSNSGRNTNATNATGPVSNHPARFRDNSPVLKRAEMQKSNSPGVKLPKRMSDSNLGSSIGTTTTKLESSAGISSPGFDPAAKYRSTSPGVKRFLGAKV